MANSGIRPADGCFFLQNHTYTLWIASVDDRGAGKRNFLETEMKYDFNTLVDRTGSGSVKWDAMFAKDPEVPAGIVPLSIGDMELKNPPELTDGLKTYIDSAVLGYTSPTRRDKEAAVAWFSRRHGWEVDPDWLVGFDGVVPALYAAVAAFSEKGDGVIYMPPVYRPLYHAIHGSGRRDIAVPLLENAEGYVMDYGALEKAASMPDVKLLLFCSPHNPVGRVWRREELLRMGRICRKHGVIVVSDEIHMDFAMPGHSHQVYAAIDPDFRDHCIVCTAPSKTFNIAGLQVSNIVIPHSGLRERFSQVYGQTGRFGVNQLGLAACRIAYEQCEGWLDAALELIRANGEMVRAFMEKHYPEVRVFSHEGTYFLWLDFRKWGLSTADQERFMTRTARLFLDEGYVFGREGRGFERINLACPSWVLRDALERLLKAGRG